MLRRLRSWKWWAGSAAAVWLACGGSPSGTDLRTAGSAEKDPKVDAEKRLPGKPAPDRMAELAEKLEEQAAAADRAAPALPGVVVPGGGNDKPTGTLLVRCKPETALDLERAAANVAKGNFREALDVYEALLEEDADAVGPADGGRFLPVADQIQTAIGRLPAEALNLYRGKFDPQAADLLTRAKTEGDTTALLEVVRLYRHCTCGTEAVELAADRFFDAAEFPRAARMYRLRLDEYPATPAAKQALLLARIALCHLAGGGRSQAAADVLARLRKDHPDVSLNIAGRRTVAATFVENCLKDMTPAGGGPPTDPGRAGDRLQWTAEAAPATEGSEIVLRPRWIDNPAALSDPELSKAKQLDAFRQAMSRFGWGAMGGEADELEFERPIPALAAGTVYLRTHDKLRARELYSGKLVWERPLEPAAPENSGNNPNPFVGRRPNIPAGADQIVLERGRSSVTVADGRVYTVEGFSTAAYLPAFARGGRSGENGSVLVCRRADNGQTLWRLGNGHPKPAAGEEPADLERQVSAATFLTAPTFADGRLYLLAEYAEGYHCFCLDAADGRPLWGRFLSSKPNIGGNDGFGLQWYSMGSPPAVSGGTVYCLTNAGVLAALDEVGGAVQWILQYGDPTAGAAKTANDIRFGRVRVNPFSGLEHYPNPLIVAGGKVVVLPTDSDKLLAVDAADGRIAWSASRELVWAAGGNKSQQKWLAGMAGNRVIIAGPNAAAFDLAGGKMLWRAYLENKGHGRPALTDKTLYLSAPGNGIARVDVRTGRLLEPLPLPPGPDGRPAVAPLGNLLVSEGRMVSCGEWSSAAFFSFAEGKAQADRRIAANPGSPHGYLLRGGLMFGGVYEDASRADAALADFEKARELAGKASDAGSLKAADAALWDLLQWKADRAADPAGRLALLRRCESHAGDDRRRAEGRLRLAQALEEAGDFAAAADLAQALAGGPDDPVIDDSPRDKRLTRGLADPPPARPARRVGHDYVRRLLDAHGRSVYSKHDAAAAERFAKLSAAADAEGIEKLLAAYPHAEKAAACLLELGRLYREAAAKTASAGGGIEERLAASRLYARAAARLEKLAIDKAFAADPLRPAAVAGRMLMAEERKLAGEAREWLARLSKLDRAAAVAWPGTEGRTVGEVFDEAGRRLYPRGLPATLTVTGLAADLNLPVEKRHVLSKPSDRAGEWVWGGPGSRLLRGADDRAVTADDGVFLLTPKGLCMARPATGELVWRAVEGRSSEVFNPFGVQQQPVGGVVGDVVAFYDTRKIGAVRLANGKMSFNADGGGGESMDALRRGLRLPGAGIGDGLIAWVSAGPREGGGAQVMRLHAADPASGKVFQPVELGPQMHINFFNGRPPAPEVGPGGMTAVVLPNNQFAVWNVVEGKKLFDGRFPGMPAGLMITRDGILLAGGYGQAGGDNSGLFAFAPNGKRLWHLKGNPNELNIALGADGESIYVAVCRQQGRVGELQCVSAADGTVRWKQPVNKLDGQGGWRNPNHMVRFEDKLLVVTSASWPQTGNPPQIVHLPQAWLTCVSAIDGRVLWKKNIDQGQFNSGPVSPPVVTPSQVLVFTKDPQTMGTRLHVFDRESGRELLRGKALTGGFNNGTPEWQQANWSPFPELIGDNLLVETPDGVEVWK